MDSKLENDILTLLKSPDPWWGIDSMTRQILTLKASFLKSILNYSRKWQIENENLKSLLSHLNIQYQAASHDLQLQVKMRLGAVYLFQEKLDEIIKPNLQEIYNFLAHNISVSVVFPTNEAHLIEFLESLLEIIKEMLNLEVASSIVLVKKELESFYKILRFFRWFLDILVKRGLEKVEVVVFNISCLLYLCVSKDEVDVQEMKIQLDVQLKKIKPFLPETRDIYVEALKIAAASETLKVHEFIMCFLDCLLDNMIELSEKKIGCVKNQILTLHRELESLRYCTIDPFWIDPEHFAHDDYEQLIKILYKNVISLTLEAESIIFSLWDGRESRDALSNLLAMFKEANANAKRAYDKLVPKPPTSNFPVTNLQRFTNSLLQNLEGLTKNVLKASILAPAKYDIEALQKELLGLRDDFSKNEKIPREQWMRFNDVAHRVEYVIDLFVAKGCPLLNFKFELFDIIEEIKIIKIELGNVLSKMPSDDGPLMQDQITSMPNQVLLEPDSLRNGMMNPTPELLAFDDKAQRIRDELTCNEAKELKIISIVGLPGIGKTTLANSLYEHPSITSCFHVRARICVSKVYEKRRLLLEILQAVTADTEKFVKKGDEDLEHVLLKSLKGRRYLIFLDDIWEIKPWLVIKASFPDDKNGSRVMFTSRFHSIASQDKKGNITNHELVPLSFLKSWEMLHSKLFQKDEKCPIELLNVGKEIAKSCKGLPLTIDVIAGVLRSIERTEYRWQLVAENIKTHISVDPQHRCQRVLELSYNDLPDHLKPCFLYFGAFPEDAEVPVKRLTWLWIAEGFIQLQKADDSLENIAEAYLNQLIARSLVIVSQRSSLGGVKASRIHDLLHDFASTKSKEDFFLLQMKGKGNFYKNEEYRVVCDYENWIEFSKSRDYFISRVRSIFLNQIGWTNTSQSPAFNLGRYRLVRVLDLHCIKGNHFDDDSSIALMVHLRFLILSAMQDRILSELPPLQKLEAIIVMGQRSRIITVDNIWNLLNLKHFRLGYCGLDIPREIAWREGFQFANLISLSTPCLCSDSVTEWMMRRLPNLQRLSCTVSDSDDCWKKDYVFLKLDFLEKLYSLKMIYVGFVYPVGKFIFPPYLKRLTLSEFRLPWSEISTIAKLEHLEVLKLRIRAFEGEIWHMRDGEFPKLKVLSLCKLDIEEWNFEQVDDNPPPLERLEVIDCKNLLELPSFLENIMTLKAIRLWPCNSSIETWAKEIVEAQKDQGNEELEISRDPPTKTGWRERMQFLSLTSHSSTPRIKFA
ncbi:hypothetical protein M9H77_33625 [Catharanthus roseus]|uniref:Uncharacterized protein n=1 Tax=Catharanthus roseus TaxID=4058 RepID=A0ACB9ZMF8_CATRO|nr:hypothetical protein M9H77_33625 [Catharanthus roseus]